MIEFEGQKEKEVIGRKCITPGCEGRCKYTFCKKCIKEKSTIERLRIYAKLERDKYGDTNIDIVGEN